MKEEDRKALLELMKKTGGQIVYALDNQSGEQMLEEPGYILLRLQQLYTGQDSSKYHLIFNSTRTLPTIQDRGRAGKIARDSNSLTATLSC